MTCHKEDVQGVRDPSPLLPRLLTTRPLPPRPLPPRLTPPLPLFSLCFPKPLHLSRALPPSPLLHHLPLLFLLVSSTCQGSAASLLEFHPGQSLDASIITHHLQGVESFCRCSMMCFAVPSCSALTALNTTDQGIICYFTNATVNWDDLATNATTITFTSKYQ
ncbi:uncharacterized protein LOC121870745 [Homarus americanus]|uniref:uncharacterized protein LOC121870745 n=1 Tax=Homarus americanus TaxID=6706 RepID=UPI001C462115|nr:uncharacterized protein LOC121870745 [Homarus americanus]